MKGTRTSGIIMIVLALVIAFFAGREFLKTRELEPIVKGEGVTSMQRLSDYLPALKGTRGIAMSISCRDRNPAAVC
ncbi:hypothetical protein TREVI0001_2338 [Treponema vincentii ATCC 35580]|uniref:Uncharacterized protein n=1 Tax=Treponema vincentii ATCC 35580 TaxID=596324 RepID=C8PQW4_9SPIR|nr:hypothetical protein [Treponema vincentii]EEV20176.1 hypothetical protein TREVI0001_2338 [Treponema vincentii ATCC 35580]